MNWKKLGVNAAFWTAVTGGVYAYAKHDDNKSAQELALFADRFNESSFTVETAKQLVKDDQFREQGIALSNCLSDQLPGRVSSSAYQGDTYVTEIVVPSVTINRDELQECIKGKRTNHSANVIGGVGGGLLGYLLLNTPIPIPSRRRKDDNQKPKFGELPPVDLDRT